MNERTDVVLADETAVQGDASAPRDDVPVFRAVSTPTQRRGIRLEIIYWNALRMIAGARSISIGEIVGETADAAPPKANLASLLRVRAIRWMLNRVERLERLTRIDSVNAIVQASPTPAFALTADKRIVFYNSAFLSLVQSRLLTGRHNVSSTALRLTLDMHLEDVIRRLSSGDPPTLSTGYALGVDGQRLRGIVNMVLAPVHDQTVVIAFVVRNG